MAMTHTPLYYNYLSDLAGYSDREFGQLMRALLRYAAEGEEPELPPRQALVWPILRGNAERAREHYETISRARSLAGQKGAAARWDNDD